MAQRPFQMGCGLRRPPSPDLKVGPTRWALYHLPFAIYHDDRERGRTIASMSSLAEVLEARTVRGCA